MAKKKPMNLHEFRSMGGKARAKKLTDAERTEIAKKAAQTRWAKKKAVKARSRGRTK